METKFYCSRCVKEVAFNTNRCPYCGETFNAVKCPVCRFIGKPSQFARGCPTCGFIGNFSNVKKDNQRGGNKKRKKPFLNIRITPTGYRILLVLFLAILIVLLIIIFRLK